MINKPLPVNTDSRPVALAVGASRGIGAAISQALSEHYRVVLAARDIAALRKGTEAITAAGGQAIWQRTDVTDEASIKAAVEVTISTYGRLDVAVNLANQTKPPAPLAEIDTSDFDRGIATSARGTFLAMKHQIPAMLQSGGGVITNIVSVAGVTALPGLSTYVTGKAAIIALTKVAALGYATSGIRVNAIAPGPINTSRVVAAVAAAGPGRGITSTVPMQRVGQTSDVANTVIWLSSAAAGYITGTVIPVDGGQLAAGVTIPRPVRSGV